MSRYRIGVLLYFRSDDGRLLLIQRSKSPNAGLWCAVGGKLEMETGESPVECGRREAQEEVGIEVEDSDLLLRCMLSEKNYEGTGHWLMFVYEIRKKLSVLPVSIEEGVFKFFDMESLRDLKMPPLDKEILLDIILGRDLAEFHSLHVKEEMQFNPASFIIEEAIGGPNH